MQLKKLKTKFLGRNFIFYDVIDSTQNEITRLIENGNIQNGTVIMANIQTAGRGTHGRIWYTDETNNIAFSLFIDLNCVIREIEGITFEIAKDIINIFYDKYKIELDIKLPNDIVYNNKKIGGILTESKINSGKVRFLIVGVGINTSKINFSDDIKYFATSIKKEFNIDINTIEFVTEFCNRFEKNIMRRRQTK